MSSKTIKKTKDTKVIQNECNCDKQLKNILSNQELILSEMKIIIDTENTIYHYLRKLSEKKPFLTRIKEYFKGNNHGII